MLFYLTVILACQLIGELITVASGLPIPGPVIGMVLLLAGLLIKGGIPDELATVGDAFLTNLSLLFVPAGVGVMLHITLIGEEGLAITLALIGSTLATIAVTAVVMRLLSRTADAADSEAE
ncbi:CidA/LrgA family protein [Roseibium alexandrii]|uniref:Putative effector of murein hydrolase LrgA n=1 Tax=Roseibium alexandrii (strain DSM 17067 / NCIMB 14079 / DFL-11) TaxID=244592 RepID=A0A5E8GWA4_ROSAD|nr:CidA/LrgA family protein [Roseibium alexandrii]EEE44191.1 putative effector of murein hydrolase LrgA [Roseibium alexandrii DFL-11]